MWPSINGKLHTQRHEYKQTAASEKDNISCLNVSKNGQKGAGHNEAICAVCIIYHIHTYMEKNPTELRDHEIWNTTSKQQQQTGYERKSDNMMCEEKKKMRQNGRE